MTKNELYLKNERIAFAVLHKLLPAFRFDEDYIQTAKLGLWKACLGFDESKGNTFSTYAYAVIRNELYAQGKRDIRSKKNGEIISLDKTIGKELEALTLHDVIPDKNPLGEFTAIEAEPIQYCFNERQQKLLDLKLEGHNYKEISQEMNISRQRIYSILKEMQIIVQLSDEAGRALTESEYRKIKKNRKKIKKFGITHL